MSANITSGPTTWKEHAKKCGQQKHGAMYEVSTPSFDDHKFKKGELDAVGELSKVCSQIKLKCHSLACIGRPVFLWSVNKLARAVTKWNFVRLTSYIHNRSSFRQYCHVGNAAEECRLGPFQDSDFAGEAFGAYSGVERSYHFVGCARSKLQSHTVPLRQR